MTRERTKKKLITVQTESQFKRQITSLININCNRKSNQNWPQACITQFFLLIGMRGFFSQQRYKAIVGLYKGLSTHSEKMKLQNCVLSYIPEIKYILWSMPAIGFP